MLDADDLDPKATFTVRLVHTAAWMIAQRITPGASLVRADPEGAMLRNAIIALRHKVDDAILRFADETAYDANGKWLRGPRWVDITITVDEAWMLDSVIGFDALGGAGYDLLLQLYRGFWSLRYGLPALIVSGDDDRTFPAPSQETVDTVKPPLVLPDELDRSDEGLVGA